MPKKSKPREMAVKMRCVFCKGQKEVRPGDVKPGDHPMCEKCGGPMATVGASA